MLQQGMRLGGSYVLVDQIGAGGGGIVYKAYHERLETYVVVKQIKDRVKGVLENRTEVDILKKLKSPYLPQVYDFLEIDGEIYTVMEFIPGKSLTEELKSGRKFSVKEVLKWTIQLAETLSYLHGQDRPIIHSDIKPANIMLTPGGDICLIDFNISLAFNKDRNRTLAVSRGYSPPEQYSNFDNYQKMNGRRTTPAGKGKVGTVSGVKADTDQTVPNRFTDTDQTVPDRFTDTDHTLRDDESAAGDFMPGSASFESGTQELTQTQRRVAILAGQGVDERSDIYSLGATIYHLLTGVKPSYDYENIPPITSYDIPIGEGFALILTKMMELDPKDRYQNGMELLDALNHIYELDSEYRAFRRHRRIKKLLIAAAFAAGVSMAAYGLFTMQQENTAAYNRQIEQANSLIADAQYEEAQEMLTEAEFRAPKRIQAYEQEVLRLYSMGDYEKTISYGQDVINNVTYVLENASDESSLANIFYLMGNSYIELEDYANAAYCLKLAIVYDAGNGAYYRDYAVALARTGNITEAETALSQAVALGLGQDTIYMTRGEIAYAQGSYEESVSYLTDAMNVTQDSSLMKRAVVLCAKCYQAMGSDYLDEEITLLESASGSLGTQSTLQISEMLAECYAQKAQSSDEYSAEYYEKALSGFTALYESGYSTRQMMENIAILYQEMGSFDQAADMLLQMAEKYPDDYRTYKRLAFLEADIQQRLENSARDYSDFLAYYEKAAALYEAAGTTDDAEMQMLTVMLQDLKDGGWF
ncbi:MAG: protein kinase [Lachnospiraceae bacterium]|nr:protein kinase [Lachnospiraceae bacterium]